MLLYREINKIYDQEIGAATDLMKGALASETRELYSWCEKWKREVEKPVVTEALKFLFVNNDAGMPIEICMDTVIQDSISNNQRMLSALDEKIFSVYSKITKAGFKRPSVLIAESFYRNIVSEDALIAANMDLWPCINLVHSRLQDNQRLGMKLHLGGEYLRYSFYKDGMVCVIFGKEHLIKIMKQRKLVR